jgi:ABC-type branched-subunit amino acid transport system substrate-binding protein
MNAYDISLTAYRQDQFGPQVREAEAGGTRLFSCWLDAMATLSIWQSSSRRRNGSVILYCGAAQKILLDAEGLIMIDPDAPLTRNEDGKNDIIRKIRDAFNAVADDPVKAARAYALAKWVIAAYRRDGSGEAPSIAYQLERAGEIPLMDETLSIDPRTHRPKSRRYGVLKISDREYKSYGFVEVFSSEAFEK